MSVTIEQVKKVFHHLESGNQELFFKNVADDVNWKVMGTHPLAGDYHSKENFISKTFQRLGLLMKDNLILEVNNILLQDDVAAVELEAKSTTLNDSPFNNTYCWIVEFKDGLITNVRAYVDSALVQKVIDENEK